MISVRVSVIMIFARFVLALCLWIFIILASSLLSSIVLLLLLLLQLIVVVVVVIAIAIRLPRWCFCHYSNAWRRPEPEQTPGPPKPQLAWFASSPKSPKSDAERGLQTTTLTAKRHDP